MKINFTKLIQESDEKLMKIHLAKEMYENGLFKSIKSAENMIQYHQSGHAKSCDWELLKYLSMRFNKKAADIIQWDD